MTPNFKPKEIQILNLLLQGMRNKAIAEVQGTTEQTIKNRLKAIYDKSGMSSRVELALWWRDKKDGLPG